MQPNLIQLQQVILQGNDSVDNVLILNKKGSFELVQGAGVTAINGIDYVTRWNTFDAGDGYVGVEASNDDTHLGKIMEWANLAWDRYVATKQIRITNTSE